MPQLDHPQVFLPIISYHSIVLYTVRHKRIRYGGDCVCRLPLVKDNDHPGVVQSIEREEVCTKCSHSRKIIEDEVEFGIGRAEVR